LATLRKINAETVKSAITKNGQSISATLPLLLKAQENSKAEEGNFVESDCSDEETIGRCRARSIHMNRVRDFSSTVGKKASIFNHSISTLNLQHKAGSELNHQGLDYELVDKFSAKSSPFNRGMRCNKSTMQLNLDLQKELMKSEGTS